MKLSPTIAIAPMMNYTDRHCRYLLRLISRHVLLYTEMITTEAILHGKAERLLAYNPEEHPLALQLGGCEPQKLAACTALGESYGYDEVNLNIGCPSDRVQAGRFGACLMKEPNLVADCVQAMRHKVRIPVTVKTRIGVDDQDSYEKLFQFIQQVSQAGCQIFVIHARKAWLQGLSPKENREIPPLRYDIVYQLKKDFPALTFIINGGIKTVSDIKEHLEYVDGVMIGRQAFNRPWLLAEIEQAICGKEQSAPRLSEILLQFAEYAEKQLANGVQSNVLLKPLLGLWFGLPGAKYWRRQLNEGIKKQEKNFMKLMQHLLVENALPAA